METSSRQSTFESSRLVRYLNSPQWERGSSTAFVFSPYHYSRLDEAACWVEFDSKIRSARYHLAQCVEHRNRNKGAGGVASESDRSAAEAEAVAVTLSQENDSIVRWGDGNVSSNGWRQKVDSDMAISGLLALKNILDTLYENGNHVVDIAGSLTIWSFVLSASYVVRSLHYNQYLDNGALVTLCAAGYYTVSSTCQLFHVGMRALAINRCQWIVASLHNRLLVSAVGQNDVDSLHNYWFYALSWYRVEEKSGRQQYEAPFGCFVDKSLTSSEYVIPLDD